MNDIVVIPSISPEQSWQLSNGCLRDPFAVLGPFETGAGRSVTSESAVLVSPREFLVGYKPLPQAKKLLQPQRFRIRWNLVAAAPIA